MKAFGLLCLLAGTLAVAGAAQASETNGDDGCTRVHAVGHGQDLGGGNTAATITHGGLLNGTTNTHFEISGAPPIFTIVGTLVLTTKHATLTVQLTGTFDVSTGAFTATGPISGATGKLTGATGTLTLTGVEDLATGAFTETIDGTLCRAGEEDDD